MTRKLLILWAMLLSLLTSVNAQNWTWTREEPTAGGKFRIMNTSTNKYLVNNASAPLSDTPIYWTTQQVSANDGTWTFADESSTPYNLYVYCTKTAASRNANNFKATVATGRDGLTGLANNDAKYYSNIFWVKSNNNAYSFNAYLNYGGLSTQKGDIYVQGASSGLGTATSANSNNLWIFYSKEQVETYDDYVAAWNALNAINPNHELLKVPVNYANKRTIEDIKKAANGTAFYTIRYNENKPAGVTASVSGMPATDIYESGARNLSTSTPSLSGYDFLGWSTDKNAAKSQTTKSVTITDADITVYAIWGKTMASGALNIDPTVELQTMEGWGVSLCWWAAQAGKWSEEQQDEIVDWLVSPDGLNYNVFRYNIPGGDDPEHQNCKAGHMASGKGLRAEMEGFIKNRPTYDKDHTTWTYDWTADAAQVKILLKIVERCKYYGKTPILEAFSNSAPWWMTKSGCVAGGATGNSNRNNINDQPSALDDNYYGAFASYLIDVCKHFKEAYGIEFHSLAPFNEPYAYNYWSKGGGQEGCHFTLTDQIKLVKELSSQLNGSGLSTIISASDETNPGLSETTIDAYINDGAVMNLPNFTQWNTHTYSDKTNTTNAKRESLRNKVKGRKTLWMSETGEGGTGIAGNLTLAKMLFDDIRYLQPVVWCDWQAMEANDQWCLITCNGDNNGYTTPYNRNKNFYLRHHVTTFIKPGYKIVQTNNDNVLAAVNPVNDELVVCILNEGTSTQDYDLTSITSNWKRKVDFATHIVTDNSSNYSTNVPISGIEKVTAKPQSITTLVFVEEEDNNLVVDNASKIIPTKPQKDGNGYYLIGTPGELRWFAQHVNANRDADNVAAGTKYPLGTSHDSYNENGTPRVTGAAADGSNGTNVGEGYSAKAKLTADIWAYDADMIGHCAKYTGTNYTPDYGHVAIGNNGLPTYNYGFSGEFDGQGHTIEIFFDHFDDHANSIKGENHKHRGVGLFETLTNSAVVKNLHVTGYINSNEKYIGGVAGYWYLEKQASGYMTDVVSSVKITTSYPTDVRKRNADNSFYLENGNYAQDTWASVGGLIGRLMMARNDRGTGSSNYAPDLQITRSGFCGEIHVGEYNGKQGSGEGCAGCIGWLACDDGNFVYWCDLGLDDVYFAPTKTDKEKLKNFNTFALTDDAYKRLQMWGNYHSSSSTYSSYYATTVQPTTSGNTYDWKWGTNVNTHSCDNRGNEKVNIENNAKLTLEMNAKNLKDGSNHTNTFDAYRMNLDNCGVWNKFDETGALTDDASKWTWRENLHYGPMGSQGFPNAHVVQKVGDLTDVYANNYSKVTVRANAGQWMTISLPFNFKPYSKDGIQTFCAGKLNSDETMVDEIAPQTYVDFTRDESENATDYGANIVSSNEGVLIKTTTDATVLYFIGANPEELNKTAENELISTGHDKEMSVSQAETIYYLAKKGGEDYKFYLMPAGQVLPLHKAYIQRKNPGAAPAFLRLGADVETTAIVEVYEDESRGEERAVYYDLQGRRVSKNESGILIKKVSNGNNTKFILDK